MPKRQKLMVAHIRNRVFVFTSPFRVVHIFHIFIFYRCSQKHHFYPTYKIDICRIFSTINYFDMLQITNHQIGSGATCSVLLGTLGDEKVAVKVFKKPSFATNDIEAMQKLSLLGNAELESVAILPRKVYSGLDEFELKFGYFVDVCRLPIVCIAFPLAEYTLNDTICDSDKFGDMLKNSEKDEIVHKLVQMLAKVHACGVAHCDIKASNIAWIQDSWKLIDFADACMETWRCVANRRVGTPNYLAPEFWMRNEREGMAQMYARDVFALGMTLFYMFSGGSMNWKMGLGDFKVCEICTFYKDHTLEYFQNKFHHHIQQNVPQKWWPLLEGMLNPDVDLRWNIERALEYVNKKTHSC